MIRDLNKLIRYLAYVLELLVLFMLQETPGLLPSIFGARPVLLFPAVVAIAMLEPEVPALLFGVVGGLFCDFGLSGMLGFHALVLGVLCFFISLVIRTYLQNNMATAILTGVWSLGLVVLAQWFFLSSNIPIRPMPLPTTTCQSIFTPFCSFPCSICSTGAFRRRWARRRRGPCNARRQFARERRPSL